MNYTPDEYKDVEIGTVEKGICSPKAPSADWKGIIITAPEIVHMDAGKKPQIPICGYYMLSVADMMNAPKIKIILRLDRQDEAIIGIVGPTNDMEDEPEDPLPDDAPVHAPQDLEGIYSGGYFNIDAQEHIKLPLLPGTYELTIEYAKVISNSAKLELKTDGCS